MAATDGAAPGRRQLLQLLTASGASALAAGLAACANLPGWQGGAAGSGSGSGTGAGAGSGSGAAGTAPPPAGAGAGSLPAAPSVPAPAAPPSTPPLGADEPPSEPREARAAWVATVANIDWPSAPGLSTAQQQAEALKLLDRAQQIGLNLLILQVRPMGDALYPSALEPWSEYLTGVQGRAPEPAWDPLAFWVAQAHARGLELHAWFNPYRARHKLSKSPSVAPHLAATRPDIVKAYGDQLWMDPGEADAAARLLAVVEDLLRRYDVDGVHIDDYFYPYPESAGGIELPFPDDISYARYRLAGGELAREDWRRSNVDQMVQALQALVRRVKPWVKFGISPFGLPRPDRRPAGIVGFSQYDKLYADAERWFENGWLDYFAPQLYWQIDKAGQQFPVLLDYWAGQNRAQRHLWPGLFTSLVTKGEPGTVLGPRAWLAREVLDQVQLVQRQRATGTGRNDDRAAATAVTANAATNGTANAAATNAATNAAAANASATNGHIHFSMVALLQNRDGIATLLQFGPYAQAALVPATPWLDSSAPPAPQLALVQTAAGRRLQLTRAAASGPRQAPPLWLALWLRRAGVWRLQLVPVQPSPVSVMVDATGADLAVASSISRTGVAGARISLRLATLTPLPALSGPASGLVPKSVSAS